VSIRSVTAPVDANGNSVGSLSIVNVNGIDQVQFTPTPGLNIIGTGTEATFTYTIRDTDDGTTTTASTSFRVEPNALSGTASDDVATKGTLVLLSQES
jgi:hypothetical protein